MPKPHGTLNGHSKRFKPYLRLRPKLHFKHTEYQKSLLSVVFSETKGQPRVTHGKTSLMRLGLTSIAFLNDDLNQRCIQRPTEVCPLTTPNEERIGLAFPTSAPLKPYLSQDGFTLEASLVLGHQ